MRRKRKVTQRKRQVHLRIEANRKQDRLHRRRLNQQRKAIARGNIPRTLVAPCVIYAPRFFLLSDDTERPKLLRFLATLREATISRGIRTVIDFSQTERMVACGTLLFLAEVKRIMHLIGEGRRSPIAPRNVRDKKVAQVLQQVGFFTSVRCASNVQPTAADVIHWRSVSGTGADGKKADELVEEIKHLLPARLSSPMYNGLVEAMTNCIHHAYIGERRDGIEYRGMGEWWMFATEQDGRLYVSICDLGIGIPRSLPLTQSKQTILELLARIGRSAGVSHSDSALIGAAIELGRTRTHLEHRGKGFRDMLDVIDTAGSGRMNIHSNHGLFQYQLQEGKKHTSRKNFQQSILGTIIQWAVPVQTERT